MTVLTTDFVQPTMDDYPTRKTTEPALLYRKDPAVWGDAADGPIDSETLAGYDENGYLQIDSLLTQEELREYRAELDRLRSDAGLQSDERVVVEPGTTKVRSIYEVHKISELFARLVADPRVAGRARQILGSEVYVHQSRVNHERRFTGTDLYWTSDFETWHAEDGMPRMRAVSIAIALTDNESHNGALMVMPGSHRTFVSCVGEAPDDRYRSTPEGEEAGAPDQCSLSILAEKRGVEMLTGPAGSATMLDSNCMHAASSSLTPFPRSSLLIVFNSVENTCAEPFSASSPRPEFLGARDFTTV
ncbi:ectoine hydroxylase [Nocardiopsis ansamitocini]|uniref:Ectoine hydroxylase n=1 Tax=Nocardiopsis ansamitocini TaxID=1670832 RepID=A0A9W6P544_9ACTN|nr:ectoine hydroxylase [Nocardiopsis ansamitocini]GLU47534.1 ectoine dioxygenase [Nocardiopsis ansamitocini]